MTLQDYIDQVRNLLDEDDPNNSFWTDKQLTDWINEAQKEVAKITKFLTEKAYLEPTDENEYTLPADFIEDYIVKIDGDIISSIPIKYDGEEEGYYIWGNRIHLSDISKTGKLTLYYYRTPQKMTDKSHETELPMQYEDILMPFVAYRAFQKDLKADQAKLYQQEFMERANVMRQKFSKEPNYINWKVVR